MANTALGVAPDSSGNGVTPLTHRLILGAQWANTGVVDGLEVTGRSDLRYNVSAGVAVCSRGSSDGKTLAYHAGGQTPAVSAGDASFPRIDLVWVKANNKLEYSDSDNYVTLGVTMGTPASSPKEPTCPTGCTVLRKMRMPAGATSTQNATAMWTADYALPYGASLGKIAEHWDKRDMIGDGTVKKYYLEQEVSFSLPTDRMLEFSFKTNFSSAGATSYEDMSHRCEWAIGFQVDGKDLDHSCANFISYGAWETHETSYVSAVSKGHHTARVRTWLQNGSAPHFHYNGDTSNIAQYPKEALWCGRRFIVWDRGAVV